MTKYEALEKNAVSEPEMPQLENLQYSPICRNGSLCWGIFDLSHGRQCEDRTMLAEGERFELTVRFAKFAADMAANFP
jgi:hypothetical protein